MEYGIKCLLSCHTDRRLYLNVSTWTQSRNVIGHETFCSLNVRLANFPTRNWRPETILVHRNVLQWVNLFERHATYSRGKAQFNQVTERAQYESLVSKSRNASSLDCETEPQSIIDTDKHSLGKRKKSETKRSTGFYVLSQRFYFPRALEFAKIVQNCGPVTEFLSRVKCSWYFMTTYKSCEKSTKLPVRNLQGPLLKAYIFGRAAIHINLFLHWRSIAIDFIDMKTSFFVPLYHLPY